MQMLSMIYSSRIKVVIIKAAMAKVAIPYLVILAKVAIPCCLNVIMLDLFLLLSLFLLSKILIDQSSHAILGHFGYVNFSQFFLGS